MRKLIAAVLGWLFCIGSASAAELSGALAFDEAAQRHMERSLVAYRKIATHDPWPPFPEGRALRPGDTDPRISAVREILLRTGDLGEVDTVAAQLYTPELAEAVRAFQQRHGLNPDATIGRATAAALAVPAGERAQMLSLNLERLRALERRLPPDAIVVNIPAFALTVFTDNAADWQTRVIVGKPSWRTPTFDSTVVRIELNPYWNVPPSIARRELAPIIAEDPTYLARHDMKILPGNRLRQDPGPDNPLGQIKFQIPNSYDVYLHDTPGKRSFALDMRALSHGCIRVEHAMELGARLLAAEPGWSAERLAAEVATGRNIQIPLSRPVPVAIVYVTAWVDPTGATQFRRDLYGKDNREEATAVAENPYACGAAGLG